MSAKLLAPAVFVLLSIGSACEPPFSLVVDHGSIPTEVGLVTFILDDGSGSRIALRGPDDSARIDDTQLPGLRPSGLIWFVGWSLPQLEALGGWSLEDSATKAGSPALPEPLFAKHFSLADGTLRDGTAPEITLSDCGNGRTEKYELCDDGEHSDGDGCASLCRVEAGARCTGSPSRCEPVVCGDGIVAVYEECDVGAALSPGCERCKVAEGWTCDRSSPAVCDSICGDGVQVGNEECDDGNTRDGDQCSKDCRLPT